MAHSTNPNPDDKPQSVGGFGFGFGTSVKCLLDCAAIRFTTSFGKQKQNIERWEEWKKLVQQKNGVQHLSATCKSL